MFGCVKNHLIAVESVIMCTIVVCNCAYHLPSRAITRVHGGNAWWVLECYGNKWDLYTLEFPQWPVCIPV